MKEITNDISLNIDFALYNYLGEDIKIFNKFEDSFVFGGFTRDAIVGDKINDLDMVCSVDDAVQISFLLEKNKWFYNGAFAGKEKYKTLKEKFGAIAKKYKNFLCEVYSFTKKDKEIQLIIPNRYVFKGQVIDFVKSVDMTASSVAYNIQHNYCAEMMDGALKDILNKDIKIIDENLNRGSTIAEERIQKLIKKGWSLR